MRGYMNILSQMFKLIQIFMSLQWIGNDMKMRSYKAKIRWWFVEPKRYNKSVCVSEKYFEIVWNFYYIWNKTEKFVIFYGIDVLIFLRIII